MLIFLSESDLWVANQYFIKIILYLLSNCHQDKKDNTIPLPGITQIYNMFSFSYSFKALGQIKQLMFVVSIFYQLFEYKFAFAFENYAGNLI